MTVATLPPINLVGGVTINPLAAGGWQDNQVAYAVLYNTTQYPVTLNTGSGPKLVPALSAQMVATGGLGLTISTTNPLPSSGLTGLGVVTLAIYDESEEEPEGFPITLTTGAADYQLAVAYQPGGVHYLVPPGFNAFVVTGAPGTIYSVVGDNTGAYYANNAILPTTIGGGSGVSEATVLVTYPDESVLVSANAPINLYANLSDIPSVPPQLEDQGQYGMSLRAWGTVSFVPSPMGPAFGQAAVIGTSAGGFQGGGLWSPTGTNAAQGTIVASYGVWNLDITFTPTAADIASGNATIISRFTALTPGREWVLNLVSGVPNFTYYDSGYAAHTLVGSLCTAGAPCQLTITWNGTNWYLVQAGTLKATLAGSTVATPLVQPMIIGWNANINVVPLLGPIDEVRVSYLNRLYTYPTTGPLVKDIYTECLYEFDFAPPVNTGQAPVYTVTVPNPAQGADWSYTLPAPARLRSLWARFTTSIAAATRYPDLIVSTSAGQVITYLPMSATGVVASVTQDVAMGPGMGPITSVTETGVDVKCMVGFPDMLLPAGCTLVTSTKNIATADQWAPIELTLSPV